MQEGGRRWNLPTISERSAEAHRKTVQSSVSDIARFLEEIFGRKLLGYMTGVSDKAVAKWINKERQPRREAEDRLRAIFQIYQLLQAEENPHTVRAWFVGMNPQLDDVSPATAFSEGRIRDVLVAAKSYIAGG